MHCDNYFLLDAASDLWLTKCDIWEFQNILIRFLILGHICSLENYINYARKAHSSNNFQIYSRVI